MATVALVVSSLLVFASEPATAAQSAAVGRSVSQNRAVLSYQALQDHLYLRTTQLYMPSVPSSSDPFSFLWPFTDAMAGTDYLAGVPDTKSYGSALSDRLNGLLRYRNFTEHTPGGVAQPPAFESAVAPPLGPGGDTYYDDNAWAALDLLHQYQLTGSSTYLNLAEQTFRFVVTGWSTDPLAPCPGGVPWVDASWSGDRNTVSNAPNAEVGAQLYQITGQSFYLSWAKRMYNWVNACLAAPGGLYYDHVSSTGTSTRPSGATTRAR